MKNFEINNKLKIYKKALEIAKECICQNCTLKFADKSFCECRCNARNIEYFLHQAQIELKGGAK